MRARRFGIGLFLVFACGEAPDDTMTSATDGTTAATTGAGTTGTTGATDGTTGGTTAVPTTGGDDTSTGPGTSTGGTTGDSTGDATGGTTAGGCTRCAEALMGGDDDDLCPASEALYDAIFACVCAACEMQCVEACTMGGTPQGECQTCQSMAFQDACGTEVAACFADM